MIFSQLYNNLVIQVMKQRIDSGSIYIGANYPFPSAPSIQSPSSGPVPYAVDYSQSGNAFANLRNEITNLKLQFSKLVQKDAVGHGDSLKKKKQGPEQRESQWHIRENRISSQYQFQGCQIQKKNTDYNNGVFNFERNKHYGNQKENEFVQIREESASRQSASKIGSGCMVQTVFDGKLQSPNKEIARLIELKLHLQQKIHILSQQLDKKTFQFKFQLQQMERERNKWREAAEKAEISLSLKNSFIEKLQQTLKVKQQEKILLEKQSLNRYQALSDQYFKCQQELAHSTTRLQVDIHSLQQQNSLLKSAQAQSASQITQLQQEVQQLREHTKNLSHPKTLLFARAEEPELADLKKRVEAFQRSIEHLNSANTATRQKLAQAQSDLNQVRQELKKSNAKVESLLQENNIKQALISSLYRDISILDKQIRQISHLKATLALSEKSIDDLNETIMQLQCEKHNYRYSHIVEE